MVTELCVFYPFVGRASNVAYNVIVYENCFIDCFELIGPAVFTSPPTEACKAVTFGPGVVASGRLGDLNESRPVLVGCVDDYF